MHRFMRFVLVLFLAGTWRLFRRWLRPRLIFQVYGNERQRRVYWPSWAQRFLPTVFPIGLILFDKGWGFIGATKISEEELDEDPFLVQQVLDANRKAFPLAHAVALAGRLPSFARRAKIELKQPFLWGLHGTTFAVLTSLEHACVQHSIEPSRAAVAIVGGYGHAGTHLVKHMRHFGMPIIVERDELAHERRKAAGAEDVDQLVSFTIGPDIHRADIVVNLSRRGDDMLEYAAFLRDGAVVLDDTHPPMHKRARSAVREAGGLPYKVIMRAGNLRMYPRLPDFSPDWVPGCLLEALVVQSHDWSVVSGQYDWFANAAKQAGVHTELVPHLNEKF